jgi:hypothetical protein
LGGEGEVGTVEMLGRGEVGELRRSGAEAEEDPGEMVIPVGGGGTGAEGGFEAAVESFNEAVGLWVVGGGGIVLNVEGQAEVIPKGRGKLWSTV